MAPGKKSDTGPKAFLGEKGLRVARVWEAIMVLAEAERPLTVQEVNDRVAAVVELSSTEGHVSTTRTDLRLLRRMGFPIDMIDAHGKRVPLYDEEEIDDRRGKYKNMRWALRDPALIGEMTSAAHRVPSSPDLMALSFLRTLLSDHVPGSFPLYKHVRRLTEHLQSHLNRTLRDPKVSFDRLREQILRLGKAYIGSGPALDRLLVMADAIRRDCVVRGMYHKPTDDAPGTVMVAPKRLWFDEGRAFILAVKMPSEELRIYRLDRFEEAELRKDMKSRTVSDEDLEATVQSSIRGFASEPVHVVLDVHPVVAYLFREYQYHPTQRIDEMEDGSIVVTFDCAPGWAIEEMVLGLGEFVIVREPVDLAIRVRDRIAEMARNYDLVPGGRNSVSSLTGDT